MGKLSTICALFLCLAAWHGPFEPTARAAVGTPENREAQQTYERLRLLGRAFDLIKREYVEKPDENELIEAAIDGMLRSLDPHSAYLNEQDFNEMQLSTRGDFGGLGIEVTMENGLVKVVSPIDDTPAFRAGLKSGDFITRIDGSDVLGLSLNDAVRKMRGKPGSPIDLTILSPGAQKPRDVTLNRGKIKINPIKSHLEGGDIGYIRVSTFNEKTADDLEEALKKLGKDKAIKGLVVDLRNNPGGLLDQAVKVTDLFLPEGEIVFTQGRDGKNTMRFAATTETALEETVPMVVLINNGSASASEIVAGALQDHRRAVIMGVKSFGKGTVQTIRNMNGGKTAIRISTARYYTPSGRSIQATGIEPDILVAQATIKPTERGQTRTEAALTNALPNPAEGQSLPPRSKQEAEGKSEQDDSSAKSEDYQLSRAIDLLRGLSLARATNS